MSISENCQKVKKNYLMKKLKSEICSISRGGQLLDIKLKATLY